MKNIKKEVLQKRKYNLKEDYMFYVRQTNLKYDEDQYALIKKIDLYINLLINSKGNFLFKANCFLLNKIKNNPINKDKKIFYIYGSVGAGKTFITNLIFRSFADQNHRKLKMNFYEFIDLMRLELNKIHLEKNNLNKSKNIRFSDLIYQKLKNIDILCIDEFHILDISDAMIIYEFFKILLKIKDIIVIINSNRSPDELYKDGIHKERFKPVLNIIKENSHIFLLETKDYRIDETKNLKNFVYFKDENFYNIKNELEFENLFLSNTKNPNAKFKLIKYTSDVHKMKLKIINFDGYSYILIDFMNFFSEPLYAINYKNLISDLKVKCFYINGILNLDNHNDIIKRFISFIDIIYEMNINIVIGSNVSILAIYTKGSMIFEFDRLISRLNVLCRERKL